MDPPFRFVPLDLGWSSRENTYFFHFHIHFLEYNDYYYTTRLLLPCELIPYERILYCTVLRSGFCIALDWTGPDRIVVLFRTVVSTPVVKTQACIISTVPWIPWIPWILDLVDHPFCSFVSAQSRKNPPFHPSNSFAHRPYGEQRRNKSIHCTGVILYYFTPDAA